MELLDRLNENLNLWINNDQTIYNETKSIIIENNNTLACENKIIEYLQGIDKVANEIGTIGISYVVDKQFIEDLIEEMEIKFK